MQGHAMGIAYEKVGLSYYTTTSQPTLTPDKNAPFIPVDSIYGNWVGWWPTLQFYSPVDFAFIKLSPSTYEFIVFSTSVLEITTDAGQVQTAPTLVALQGQDYLDGYMEVDYKPFVWEQIYITSTLSIDAADKTETASVPIQWSQKTGGAVATDTSGQIHFTDTDTSALPVASIVGAPTIVVHDYQGNDISSRLTASQLAILQTAFTISPEAGNSNNGVIDWKFSYHGSYYDLDFLAGKTVTVTNTVQVSDAGNGLSDTATVTNTLNLPQYAGIDYRHSASDLLVSSDIKSAGLGLVGEYLGGDNSYLTRTEAKSEIGAGLQIFSIYEHAGMDDESYYASAVANAHGVTDATNALKNAKKVGETPGAAIYFGIDLDPADFGNDLSGLVSYFAGIKSVFDADKAAHYAVGVYGGGDVDQMIKEGANLATYAMLAESTGWSGSKTYTGWNIEQIRDPSLIGSTDFPSTSDFRGISYIAGDLTQGATGAWNSMYSFPAVAQNDFTGSGRSDIPWFNAATGDVDEWQITNGKWAKSVDIGSHPGSGWQITGTGDFNADGTSDLFWFNATNGQTDIWEMQNGQWSASVSPGAHPAGYQVAGVGDFTGSGTSDVLFYNATSGDADEWQIANGKWAASVDLGTHPGNGWQIAGVGDANGDGTSDVFWYNQTTGQSDIWELSNGKWAASVSPGNHPTGYTVAGIGDFTGDGTSDLLFFNPTTGDVDEWLINNGKWAGSVDLGSHPGSGWQISGVGDYNGDGTSDVLWSNPSTGGSDIWLLANGKWAASVSPGTHPTGYQVAFPNS
jgi:hypothetical protein